MGQKITKLKASGGFCAETAGGITLLLTALVLTIPCSAVVAAISYWGISFLRQMFA